MRSRNGIEAHGQFKRVKSAGQPAPVHDRSYGDGGRYGAYRTIPHRLESAKRFIIEGLAAGKLKPVVAKTFPLEQIVEAHHYLESNQQIGKIVVTV